MPTRATPAASSLVTMAPGPALSWATENARSARRHGRRWPLHDWCWLSPPRRWVAAARLHR
jgi:hypothetical protein